MWIIYGNVWFLGGNGHPQTVRWNTSYENVWWLKIVGFFLWFIFIFFVIIFCADAKYLTAAEADFCYCKKNNLVVCLSLCWFAALSVLIEVLLLFPSSSGLWARNYEQNTSRLPHFCFRIGHYCLMLECVQFFVLNNFPRPVYYVVCVNCKLIPTKKM